MRLCLIRHFAPDVAPGICYGQTDLDLKESAQDQAKRVDGLRQQLAGLVAPGTPLFSSPLRRCTEVAVALSTAFAQDTRLRELNFGAWEMQTWDAIGPQALDAWAADLAGFRPPGGETGYEVQQRALNWLFDVNQGCDHVIAVTHGGVMRALQAYQLGLPGPQWLELHHEYGELLCLDFTPEQMNASSVQLNHAC